MTSPDIKMIIGKVAEEHGILLKPDDPAFAIVTINRLVLEHYMQQYQEEMAGMPHQWEIATASVQANALQLLLRPL